MKNKTITIFIENNSHLRFVIKLIEILSKENKILVISLDTIFNLFSNKNITSIVVKDSKELISTLLNLKCDLFFTTTPGLNKTTFPKSKIFPKINRPKYIYIFHSLVSPNEMYANNSFYFFDYIISPSEIVSRQLKYIVSNKTNILTFGYLLFDNEKAFSYKNFFEEVLIAPSWGEQGLSKNLLLIEKISECINDQNLEAVFRPHPMNLNEFENINIDIFNCKLDLNRELNNLQNYKFLITDCSGIALEFYFLTKRPVLFVNLPKKRKRTLSFSEKKLTLIEDKMKKTIGNIVEPHELSSKTIIPFIDNKENAMNFISEVCIFKDVLNKIINFNY